MKKYLEDPVLHLTASALDLLRRVLLLCWVITLLLSVLIAAAISATVLGIYLPSESSPTLSTANLFTGLAITLLLYLMTRFIKALHELVLSVGEGWPLSQENANRLRLMGWISVAMQILIIVIMALSMLGSESEFDIDTAFDLIEGILIAAVLFILARVFEHGAKMQDELEGTV